MPRRRLRLDRGASATSDSLSRLIARAPDVIFRVRLVPRPKLEFINPAVLAVTGYTPREFYADAGLATRIVHPADRRRLHEVARKRRVPGRPVVVRWRRKDGAVVRTEVTAVPVHNRQGALIAVEGIARDVTTSRPDETPGRVVDRFLRAAFEQAPLGLAHLGGDGRILHVNRRLCEITGYTAENLRARRMLDITHPDDVERAAALLQQVRASEAGHATIQKRLRCAEGTHVWVRMIGCRLSEAGPAASSLAIVEPASPPAGKDVQHERLAYCGIEVDPDRLDVTLNGRPVAVTLKEVLLLRYLIRHRGEMLTRDRLLRDVWGHEQLGRSRTLDVHVCRLRRKLPPLADSLATIGHFGYTLSERLNGQAAPTA